MTWNGAAIQGESPMEFADIDPTIVASMSRASLYCSSTHRCIPAKAEYRHWADRAQVDRSKGLVEGVKHLNSNDSRGYLRWKQW